MPAVNPVRGIDGDLERLLSKIGKPYPRDPEYGIRAPSEQIEPILIAGVGAIVLVVACGVFPPIRVQGSAMMRE